MRRKAAPAALALALALSPVPGRAEEWYDAYERGVLALQKKQADRAIEQLERAIRKRPEPGTNLFTYGTNRVREYFPYVRLAEARLMAGDPAAAREALRRSETFGREPAAERARLLAEAGALERARAAAVTPTATALPPRAAATSTPPTVVAEASATPTPAPAAATPAPVTATPAARTEGTLDLRSEPGGASVLVDGRLLGATPLRVEVPAGSFTVTLRKEGTADQTFPVRVVAGRTTSATRALIPAAPTATPPKDEPALASLVVYSDPPGATVYLDDEPVGTTDPASGRLVKSGVTPGSHRVRASAPGRPEAGQDVTVGPEGPTTVRVSLGLAPRGLPWPLLLGVGGLVVVTAGTWLWRRRAATADATLMRHASPASRRSAATTGRSRPTVILEPTVRTPPPPVGASPTTVDARGEPIDTRTLPTPPRPATVGERFGEYLLLDQLGKGGMAHVFRAERGGEHVALKRPLPGFLDDPEFRERFLREAEIGRTLHHPNIIRIFERGETLGVPYFTMELVKGETLQARLQRRGSFKPRAAAQLIAQVAEALDYAHLKGVVHRDLKPSNIMILPDGTVRVMDYGIARARRFDGLTLTGAFLGTPDYVAPETAEGHCTDARSDLYSLGVVFYEILTAKKPFVGDTPFATIRKHCTEPPTPPSVIAAGVPRALEVIVLRLLAKQPDDRYPGAEELLIELRDYINRAA